MPDPVSPQKIKKERFIEAVASQVTKKGYGFVPFIGSGISHGSGIMVGTALGQYLSYAIWRCVAGYESGKNAGRDGMTLVSKGWPGRPTQIQSQQVSEWATSWYCQLLDQHKIHPDMANGFNLADLYRPANIQYRLPPAMPQAFDQKTFDEWKWSDPQNLMSVERLRLINKSILELHSGQLMDSVQHVFTPCQGVSRTSRRYIVETAIRSLHDWRLALHFLARLRQVDGLLHLAPECDQYVIDSFNIFITRGRKPCLAHQMVSFLVRPLRIRKLLTTNFDTLLEDAFRDIDVPVQVFSIERNSRLPDPNSVSMHKTLIKLHGSLHETRADYSLDESPDDQDKEAFLRYLWPTETDQPVALPCHLLVLGTSIPDKRNVELIKHVCDRIPEFHIYIVVYDSGTADSIADSFGAEYRDRITYTVANSLDLILYELYQVITHSLPPAGFKFEFTQYVPPFESESRFFPYRMKSRLFLEKQNPFEMTEDAGDWEKPFESAEKFRSELLGTIGKAKDRIVVLDGKIAVTKVGAIIFYELWKRERKECIWFELEDFDDPALLLSELFRTVSQRLGLYSIENVSIEFPCSLSAEEERDFIPNSSARHGSDEPGATAKCRDWRGYKEWEKRVELKVRTLIQHFGIEPSHWCLFFYGRNVAGSCSGIHDEVEIWKASRMDWKRPRFRILAGMMSLLVKIGFRVLYIPYTPLKHGRYKKIALNAILRERIPDRKELEKLLDVGAQNEFVDDEHHKVECGYLRLEFDVQKDFWLPDVINQTALYFLGSSENDIRLRRRRFLYASTLFRQSRHISALMSEAVQKSRDRYECFLQVKQCRGEAGSEAQYDEPGNTEEREDNVRWVRFLYQKKIRFFNRKPGGFAWMFRDVRLLSSVLLELSDQPYQGSQNLKELRTRIHFWIGEWYLRAFYSSNHVDPLKEAIYHKLMSVRTVLHADLRHTKGKDKSQLAYRVALLSASLSSIAKILMISRESLRYWVAGHQGARFFYWESMRVALGLAEDFDFVDITDRKRSAKSRVALARFVNYVGTLIGDDNGGYSLQEDALTQIQNLLRSIQRECFKLEREMLRNSNYYIGVSPGNGRGFALVGKKVHLVLMETTGQHVTVDLNIPVGFEPGVKWENIFKKNIHCSRKEVAEQFDELWKVCERHLKSGDNFLVSKIKDIKHDCIDELSMQSGLLYAFLQLANEYTYWLVRQAKYENRCLCMLKLRVGIEAKGKGKRSGQVKISTEMLETQQLTVRRHWELVGVVSQMSLDLIHNLDPSYLYREHRLKIRLLTFCGLSLGRLSGFHDAHQVLNEATGLAYGMSVSDSRREMVILRLRRAEVHLLEATEIGKELYGLVREEQSLSGRAANGEKMAPFHLATKNHQILCKYRSHLSKLDDAWTVLGEVESMLSSCMHSAFWCGKYYYLRIMVYAEHCVPRSDEGELIYRPKSCGELENAGENLLNFLEQGLLCCGDDEYRKLCFLNLIAKASKKMALFLVQLQRHSGQRYVADFKFRVVQRICRVLVGVADVRDLREEIACWDDLLPCREWKKSSSGFKDFRYGVVINFEKEIGPLRPRSKRASTRRTRA